MRTIKQITNKQTDGAFKDVKMDHITVLSNGWILDQSISGLEPPTKLENNNHWVGLCTTGLGPCIGMIAIGKDKNEHIIQGLIHLSDIVNTNTQSLEFFDALKILMKSCGCLQFETFLFGGNELTAPLREKVLAFSSDEFPIKDCQQNLSSDERYYTNIYVMKGDIEYEEVIVDKNLENKTLALLSNKNIFSVVEELFSSCSSNSSEDEKKSKVDGSDEDEKWIKILPP